MPRFISKLNKITLAVLFMQGCLVLDANAMSMVEVVQLGMERSSEVKSANAKIKQFEIEIDVARYGYLPVFDASVGPANGLNSRLGYELNLRQVL